MLVVYKTQPYTFTPREINLLSSFANHATMALEAWHLLAIFVATIVGIILKPRAVAMIGIATALTATLSVGDALSGFSNSTIWLIGVAFFIAGVKNRG